MGLFFLSLSCQIAWEIAVSEWKKVSFGKVVALSAMKLLITVISGGSCPACRVIPCMFRMSSWSLRDAVVAALENNVVLPMLILALCVVAMERSEAGLRSVIVYIVVKREKNICKGTDILFWQSVRCW